MGREKKMGLSYFPFDTDTFQDIKVRKLIKYQGGKAITIYALLLCIIYKDGYYTKWDTELPFIISEQTGFEEAYISEVIKSCLALGLFDKSLFDSDEVLTSKGIQIRYQEIAKQIRRNGKVDKYNVIISSEEKHISSEEKGVSSEEKRISYTKKPITSEFGTQRKGKERKVNNTTTTTTKKNDENFIEEMRNQNSWLEAICIKFKITLESVQKRIDDFYIDCKCRDTVHLDTKDAMRHFNDWLRIQLNYENKAKSNGTDKQKPKDKRRGNEVTATKAEDYETTF